MLSSDVAVFIFLGWHILNSAVSLVDRRRHSVRLRLAGWKQNSYFGRRWEIARRPESSLSRTGCSDLAILLNYHFPSVNVMNESVSFWSDHVCCDRLVALLLAIFPSNVIIGTIVESCHLHHFPQAQNMYLTFGWYYLSAKLWLLLFPECCLAVVCISTPTCPPPALQQSLWTKWYF